MNVQHCRKVVPYVQLLFVQENYFEASIFKYNHVMIPVQIHIVTNCGAFLLVFHSICWMHPDTFQRLPARRLQCAIWSDI